MANQSTPVIQIKDSNVGIGTTSPTRKLQITDGEVYLRFNPTTVAGSYILGAADGKFYVIPEATFVPTMTFNSGNVLIGTTTDAGYKLDVNGIARIVGNVYTTGEFGIELTWSGNTINDSRIGRIRPISTPSQNPYAGGLAFDYYKYDGSTYTWFEGMRLNGAGNLIIGTSTDSGARLSIDGGAAMTAGWTRSIYVSANYPSIVMRSGAGGNSYVAHQWDSGSNYIFNMGSNADTPLNGVVYAVNASTRNMMIGTTTDAGYKLNVNGTFLSQGTAYFSGNVNFSNQYRTYGLPYFEMGGGGITDEYLLLVPNYVSGFYDPYLLMGELQFQRGSTSTGNDNSITTINIQTAYNNTAFYQFSIEGATVWTSIDLLSVNGVQWLALKARTNGGGPYLVNQFVGNFTDSGSQMLTRIRLSDAGVSLITANVYLPSYTNYSTQVVNGSLQAKRFSNVGFLGTGQLNARNHFTPLGAGSASPATGWIAAAFGDALADRVVIGQWTNGAQQAIIGAHNPNLDSWADTNYISINHNFYSNGAWSSPATMSLKSNGNLLIGTTTDPGYQLTVAGNVIFGYGGSRSVAYDSGGGNFQIKASAGGWATGYFFQGSSGTFRGGWGGFGSGNDLSYLWAGDAYDTPTMVVQGSQGNVGIGTTNPTKKLHVASGGNEGIFMEGVSNGGHWFDFKSANSNLWSMGAQPGLMGWYNRTDSTYKMVITDGGNVLIGTTTDSGYKLDVNGTGYFRDVTSISAANTFPLRVIRTGGPVCRASFQDPDNASNDAVWVGSQGFALCFGSAYDERGRFSSSGNLIIGSTTDAGYKLDIYGEILGRDDIRILNTYALVLNGTDNNWRIGRNTITDSGWLTLNTLQIVVFGGESGQGFQVVNHSGTALFEINGAGGASRFTNSVGVGVNPSGTTGRIDASNDIVAYSSSDLRLKENIKPIENALDKVKALTGVEFDWKVEHKDAHGYEGHDTGVIAQEVQEVMPTAVRTNDTGYLAVRYEKLIGLLIEAVKEQQAEIDELKKLIK